MSDALKKSVKILRESFSKGFCRQTSSLQLQHSSPRFSKTNRATPTKNIVFTAITKIRSTVSKAPSLTAIFGSACFQSHYSDLSTEEKNIQPPEPIQRTSAHKNCSNPLGKIPCFLLHLTIDILMQNKPPREKEPVLEHLQQKREKLVVQPLKTPALR